MFKVTLNITQRIALKEQKKSKGLRHKNREKWFISASSKKEKIEKIENCIKL